MQVIFPSGLRYLASPEIDRLKRAYERRDRLAAPKGARLIGLGDLLMLHQRQTAIVHALYQAGFTCFDGIRVLDFGCGGGGTLSQFLVFGATPDALFGIDILLTRLQRAHMRFPRLHWLCADGQQMPFANASFDLITQFTAFSSILDEEVRKRMASEMLRVLKPEGAILWYDFFIANPKNPDVRGIGKSAVHSLFPDCKIALNRVGLAPPLARALAPRSWFLCSCLSALRLLNTHYLALIRRKG